METDHGAVVVMVLGDRQKPVAITYHDVGANCEFAMHEVRLLARYLVRNENSEFMSLQAVTLHHNTVHILVMLAGGSILAVYCVVVVLQMQLALGAFCKTLRCLT